MSKKKEKELFKIVWKGDVMEIHLYGDFLRDSVFKSVIELMKTNRESEQPKKICFVVPNSIMIMAVKYAIPSVFYESVELEGQTKAADREVLKDAAGM